MGHRKVLVDMQNSRPGTPGQKFCSRGTEAVAVFSNIYDAQHATASPTNMSTASVLRRPTLQVCSDFLDSDQLLSFTALTPMPQGDGDLDEASLDEFLQQLNHEHSIACSK